MVELNKIPETQNRQVFKAVMELVVFKSKKSELFGFMQQKIKKDVKLEEVRKRLLKIKEPISEEVIKNRDERI